MVAVGTAVMGWSGASDMLASATTSIRSVSCWATSTGAEVCWCGPAVGNVLPSAALVGSRIKDVKEALPQQVDKRNRYLRVTEREKVFAENEGGEGGRSFR